MRALNLAETREISVDSASEDDETDMLTMRTDEESTLTPRASRSAWPVRQIFAATLLVAGAVTCLVSLLPGTSASSKASVQETTGLFETEKFKSLMTSQVRSLTEHTGIEDKQVQMQVDKAMASASHYIGKHASESELHSLRNVRLSPEGWETVRALLTALSDKRVQDVGHAVVQEARQNLLAGPAQIGKKVAARLQKEHLMGIAQELLPAKLRSTLLQRWASTNPKQEDIWRMILDPTGQKLAHIRDNTTSFTIQSSALLGSPRSLRDGPWGGPFKLNWAEITIGVMAVVFTSIEEVLLHIDLFMENFDIPEWVHGMFIVPAVGSGTISCAVGLSFWCDFFLGGLGLNALDALLVSAGLNLDTDDFEE